jgi:hypothetical protein
MDDAVMFGRAGRPVHLNAVRLGGGLELYKVVVEIGQRMLFDLRGEFPQFLPFLDVVSRVVAILPYLPNVSIVHPQMLWGCQEPLCGFGLIDTATSFGDRATRLSFSLMHRGTRGIGDG